MKRSRVALALASLLVACGSRSATFDEPSTPLSTARVTLRVALGPSLPHAPGAGFVVRAESRGNGAAEATTGADGVATLDLAREGSWDLTVLGEGYVAVSLLGVRGPLDTAVYTEPLGEERTPTEPHDVRATFLHAAPESVVSLFSRTLLEAEYGRAPDWRVEARYDVRPGVTDYRFWAIEWVSDGSGLPLRMRRAVALAPIPRARATDLDLTVDLDLATFTPVETAVQIELPERGPLRRDTIRRGYPSGMQYPYLYEEGSTRPTFSVGTAWAEMVRGAPGPLARFSHTLGDLTPEGASITYGTDPGPGPEVKVWVRRFPPDGALRVPEVGALSSEGSALSDATVEALADGYDTAGFVVMGFDGQSPAWVGWLRDGASLPRRGLPTLPSNALPERHFGGPRARVIATASRFTAGAPRPWEPGAARALALQVESAPAVLSVLAP